MSDAPFAPWVLRGEAIAVLAGRRRQRAILPDGVQTAPGPALVVANRWTSSPVGPFLQLSVAEPARIGLRLGWCRTLVVVDHPQARLGHRLNWGVPAELGTLRWLATEDRRELVWEERDLVLRADPTGPPLPIALPVRSIQQRADGPVVVPGRLLAKGRAARPQLEVPADDELAPLAGRHLGVVLRGVSELVREARHPVGLLATLLAPAQVGEPALRDVVAR
ncbi:MAG: hypothetical protein JWN46_2928 [Acidimicrobiales bacterium]|nr:hypothetical protein [Acidimicrobiales bacterium]